MMYCEFCRAKNGWSPSLVHSHGRCESCGSAGYCHYGTPTASTTIAEEEDDRISVLEKQVHDLKNSMRVLDATIYMLDIIAKPELKELFAGQVAVAKQTYQDATGEESMIGFRRQPTLAPNVPPPV